MADKIINDITLLFKTKLDDKSKQEIGKNLKGLLENAVISFDEAETKHNVEPIIKAIKKLFEQADMKFDADKLLEMPSREALQKVADITAKEFQTAFEKALKNNGGLDIGFNDIDTSAITESLNKLTKEVSKISKQIADTTKKSVHDIEQSIKSLDKLSKKDKVKKVADVNSIENTLVDYSSDKKLSSGKAITSLNAARQAYEKSVAENNPWVVQYKYLLDFVSKFEKLNSKTMEKVEKEMPEFRALYDRLAPSAGKVRESLEDYVVTVRGEGELSQYKNQPWGREATLKQIRDSLKNGITVKEGSGGDQGHIDDSTPPWEDNNDDKTPKRSNTKVAPADATDVDITEQLIKADKERILLAEQRRIEQEKIAETLKKEAELAQIPKTKTEEMLLEAVEEAKSKSSIPWDKLDSADQQRFIQESIWSRFIPSSSADEDILFDLEYDAFGYSNGKKGKDLSTVAARFEQWTTSLDQEYDKASDEVKQIIQTLAKIDNLLSQEAGDIIAELYEKDEKLAEWIESDTTGKWANLKSKLGGNSATAISTDSVDQTNDSLVEEVTLLEKIQKLTTYIDDNYLSSGKHLSDFLDDIQIESNELDSELKEILTTLNLIDDKGNLTFDIKRNGEEGGGTTHNGALISDDFVLIERDDYESVKDSRLPDSTQAAKKNDLNVAEVLGYLPSKHTGGFFDVQGTAKGHNLFENGVISQDVVNATEDQLEQLIQAFIKARDYGFDIENGGSNIVYDKEKGFSFYDLEELSADEAEFWNSKTEAEKKLLAIENLFSLFSGINRDHNNFENDDGVGVLSERIRSVIENKGIISPDAVDDAGRNYEDIYDDVFGGNIDDEYNNIIAALQAEANERKKITAAIIEEGDAKELNSKKNVVVSESSDATNVGSSVQIEALRSLLNAITYNVKVVQDTKSADTNKVSIDATELKSVLDGITYNVKLAHDDADKTSNKIAIDESVLEGTLNRVFGNILNPKDDGKKPESKKEPWALEKTLNTTIKGVLDQIQTNTAKVDIPSDATGISEATTKLAEIKSVLDSINAKIMKGGVIATRGAVKQAATQSVEPDVKRQATRSNMMKSLINDYKTMGKLAAQFASDGNLETKAMLENLKEEIRRKRSSLNITMDENANLREKYSIAFEAEKKLLEAEEQQKKINEQHKADIKAEKKRLADAKKLAQREAMVGKAGNAVGRAENIWMNAVGMEDVLPKEFDAQLDDYYQKLDALRKKQAELKNSDTISEEQKADLIAQTNNVNKLTEEIGGLIAEYQRLSGDNVDPTTIRTSTIQPNANMDTYEQQLKNYVREITNGKGQIKGFNAETKTLTYTVKTGAHEFTTYTAAVRHLDDSLVSVRGATKKTETFLEATARKMKEISSYMSGMALISRAGQELRRGIQYVREIDLALTELKKVTDETEESYDKFLETAAKTGARLGSTISAVTEATATFAKLGYTISDATEMAEAAIVYKNVGDNIESTEDAADSIISTMKGFRLEASESMAIIDRFNEVGNRFAITSQGIGEALRLSASALSEGGNSLDESIGLITAANEVVNDPSSVGTALKTLTLRLRGSKTELEEMGEDVSDMATTTSQLQAKLLALTGGQVDIMLDENTFKNSTQILREMAGAWEDMTDIQRASALELMGGKRQANVLSALIQNFDTVEKVIETSANSAGSALKENEKYLDSIQGKIDQFNNAMQTMWSNTLDSDMVKGIVALGTEIIKIIDTIGLIPSILAAILTYKLAIGAIKMFDLGSIGTYISLLFTANNVTEVQGLLINKNALAQKLLNSTLIQAQAARMGLTAADLAGYSVTQLLTLGVKGLAAGFKNLWIAMGPVGWVILGIIAAITAGIAIFDATTKSVEELEEELDELKSEISDMKSELESLNSELETTQDRIEELLSKDSLSFTEEEELKNLQLQNELLEKKIKLQEMLLKNKIKEENETAENLINASWNGTKADKKYAVSYYDGASNNGGAAFIKEDDWESGGISGKEALEIGIQSYIDRKNHAAIEDDLYSEVLKMMDEKDGKLNDELISRVEGVLGYDQGWFNEQYGDVIVDGFYNDDAGAKNVAEHIKSALEGSREINDTALRMQAEGIEMVLGDLLEQIPEDYEYGTSEIIDQAFDELTAYQLKYENAQGTASKSEIINTIFGTGASEELQSLEEELQEIAESEDDVATKTQKAQSLIQKAYESTDDGYKRLKSSIDIVGISTEELAKSFIATSEAADLGSIGGVLKVFAGGEKILSDFKDGIKDVQLGIDEAGESITWDNLFTEEDGKKVANNLKVSTILKGADESVREQFTKLIEEVENGKMGIDEALSKWKMVGADKAVEALNTEFETLNNEMFPDAADEISGLIDTLSELKSAFESVANTMDTFKGAQDEYNKTGRLSIKTALELMSSTDDWDKVLNITEDSITLVDGAEKALMESQLESIGKQMQTAADMAKIKLEAAENAQKAKQAFDAEANAANNLSTTEQNVNTTQQNANITTQQRTGAMGDLAVQTYGTAISELDYADNDDTVQTAESVKAKAIGLVSSSIVGLDAFIEALLDGPGGKTIGEAWSAYREARDVVINDANSKTTTVDALRKDYEKKQTMANLAANGDSYGEFSKNYENNDKDGDGVDDDKEDAIQDGWEKLVAKYDNQLALLSNERDLIQAEIDKAEARGGKASAKYYEDLKRNSEAEKALLIQKKAAMEQYLAANENAIDQDTWTDYNNEINETAVAIKECEQNTIEWAEAIREIDLHYFEQITDEVSRLSDELDFVNSLLEDEEVSDENGNWSAAALTRMGMYTNQMEEAATRAAMYQDEIDKLNKSYAKGELSEEQYQESLSDLVSGQQDAIQSYEDAKDSIVELNEARIDAIREGIEKEIEAYQDLIDMQKEELDAARDLHDFRKQIAGETKNIQELERRIASLSGSTAASDIAERRKLQAELNEARSNLDDTYYNHSIDAQSNALDEESDAYTKSKEKYIEQLEEQLKDTKTLIQNSIMDVLFNADLVYTELNTLADTYGITLSDKLTQPWKDASAQAIAWKDELQESMTAGEYAALIGEGGAITVFANGVATKLQGSWNKAQTAAANYAGYLTGAELKNKFTNTLTGFGNQIQAIINKWNGVKAAADDAYAAQTRKTTVGGNAYLDGGNYTGDNGDNTEDNTYKDIPPGDSTKTKQPEEPKELTEAQKMVPQITRFGTAQGRGMNAGKKGDNGIVTWNGREFAVQNAGTTYNKGTNLYKAAVEHLKFRDRQIFGYQGGVYGYLDGAIQKLEGRFWSKKGYNDLVAYAKGQYVSFAKGTMGTTRDQYAITDEPQFGDELTMYATPEGTLSFMRAGSTVVPADITANLVEWGKLNPDMLNVNGMPNVNMISNAVNKPELNITFDSLVKAENITEETLPAVKKLVTQELNRFTKELNYALKGKGAR